MTIKEIEIIEDKLRYLHEMITSLQNDMRLLQQNNEIVDYETNHTKDKQTEV